MADLNELIQSAKRQAAHKEGEQETVSSRPMFKENGVKETPLEADTAAEERPESVNEMAPPVEPVHRYSGKNVKTVPSETNRKKNPEKNRKSGFLQNVTDTDIEELLQMVENRKRNRKLHKEPEFPPEIMELREKCRSFMEKRQAENWVCYRITADSRNLLSLFAKVYGIQSQQLASFVILNFFEENFADFVKKVRNMGL